MNVILEACNGLLVGKMKIRERMRDILIPVPKKPRYYNFVEQEYGPIPEPLQVMVFEFKRMKSKRTAIYELTEIRTQ